MKNGQPNAEGAEMSQRAQKDSQKSFGFLFCDLCVSFAPSAFGCPDSSRAS